MKHINDYDMGDHTCKIKWGVLFPRNVCRTIQKSLDQNIIDNNKRPTDDQFAMGRIIIRLLIPQEYMMMEDGLDITDIGKSTFNKFYNYPDYNKQNRSGKERYNIVKENIIRRGKNGSWDFDSFDFIQNLKQSLIDLFYILPREFVDEYKQDVIELINRFDFNSNLKDYKEVLLNRDFYTQLTSLTAIASTWSCWEDSKQDAADLALLIIPSRDNITSGKTTNNWISSQIETQKRQASDILKKANTLYNSGHYNSAAEEYLNVTHKNFADDLDLGEAYYYLALCCHDHNCSNVSSKIDPEVFSIELLRKAKQYGYKIDYVNKLLKEWNGNINPLSLLKPMKETHGTARIIMNSKNKYTEIFWDSLPQEMKENDTLDHMITEAITRDDLVNSINLDEDCRYLLFDKSPEKNYQDFLFLLNKIKEMEKDNIAYATKKLSDEDNILSSICWEKITIYLRVPENSYSSLIDTALKILGNFTIKVFIIDDCKWSAQHLLYNHPLFLPIINLPKNVLKNDSIRINYTIISDGNVDLTNWLIREAFWLGCFYYSGITFAINLISTNVNEIESYLHFECPDMFSIIPDTENTSKVLLLKFMKQVDTLSSPKLLEYLGELNTEKINLNYYVINAGDDITNLNYGIKLREWSIRNLIENGKKPENKSLPIIAFYCQNDYIANLSKHIVVQNIDCGDMWYNNYNIIPFGMIGDRYSWDNLDGGYLEKVAQSTHLQYCGLTPSANKSDKICMLKDYFSRSYNRDSSLAVALSLPYRLFQTSFDKGDHIIPPENASNNTIEYIMSSMAKQFDTAISDPTRNDENMKNLLRYEHSRWLRWAISRGWKKATPDEVILYMKAGNPKQQLYVARLHGCICSLEDLKTLADKMCDNAKSKSDWNRYASERIPIMGRNEKEYGQKKKRDYIQSYNYIPKDFVSIDISNIKSTSDIIKTSWFDNIERDEIDTQKN